MTKEETKIAILDFVDLQNKRTELLRSVVMEEHIERKMLLEAELKKVCDKIDSLLEEALKSLGW
jgi:hypothetical protein